ncbi:MAG: peptidyl-prolyl cis-trans isomerase [candidate division KSB1 bacterium]|nr:peptidyl-prolyl cis-trans isomerase [candidate division KSB1 bacterium]MDZ7335068.1 peptidyl-prolyl cis-trans isomerase [candidate division KSB1 bacterium]MDZ7356263.1 peptidyl-prolyl cis-trans isomerase [candidate division KSB1 bacterium]MDZ7375125.1 peptidyl-prolyl cis-trans isomerase [candidate division KSB1 bacterium]MDZ7400068.1 peptidyl-prolyl cis-trans isomerase [candidate division KSB1 bacterium]
MNKILRVSLLLLDFLGIALLISCSRKAPEPIVAQVGKITIPLSEFRERYEFTPHLQMTKDSKRNREQVLIDLLGEKVLVAEAYRRNLYNSEKFKAYSQQMEKEAIIEALFEKEVASKITLTKEEVKQAFLQSQSELDVQVLSFDTMERAQQARHQLLAGKNMHEVKRAFQTDTFIAADSVLTLTIKWGDAHPNIEQAAYQLKLNEVSEPIEADGSFFLIKLINKRTNPLITEADYYREAPKIQKILRERKRTVLLTEFLYSLMADKEVKVSREIFDFVARELEKFYPIQDSSHASAQLEHPVELSLDSLKSKSLADRLNEPFARFNDGTIWTVGDFIKKLSVSPFRLNYQSRQAFRNSLSHLIRRTIELEALAQKGRKAGLEKSYYVRYQKKMWDDAYLAQQLRQQIIDTVTVSDEEVRQFYERHQNDYLSSEMVNLQEILVADESLANQLLTRIRNGEDMGKLARQYTLRELGKKNDGILGYFAPSALGKVGAVAQELQFGDLAGPVKTEDNRFSIFKVLDIRGKDPLPIEQVWNQAKRDALTEKRIKAIDQFLVKVAEKYPIKINHVAIDSLKLSDLSMLVLKQHFPNRTAAPLVAPLHQATQWQRRALGR